MPAVESIESGLPNAPNLLHVGMAVLAESGKSASLPGLGFGHSCLPIKSASPSIMRVKSLQEVIPKFLSTLTTFVEWM